MEQKMMAAANAGDQDERSRIHTAHIMSEYLFSLSMMCKHFEWHKTGMHLCAAADELKQMLHSNEVTQKRYNTTVFSK